MLGSLEQKLHLDRLVGKHDAAAFGSIEHSGAQEGGDVAVDCLDVPIDPARGFADRNRPRTAKHLEQLPTLCGKNLPKKLR